MPLQKMPRNGSFSTDSHSTNRNELRGRRRTLQTINELNVAGGASSDPFMATRFYAQPGQTETKNGAKKDLSSLDKRPILPSEGHRTQSLVTSAPPTRSARQRSQSVQGIDSMAQRVRYEQGWNIRRAQARMQHGQTVANAATRRESSHHMTHATSMSTLPKMSALALAKPQEVQARNHSNQRHVPRNSHTMSNPSQPLERRSSLGGIAGHADYYIADTQSQRHASLKSSSHNSGLNRAVRQSRSDTFDEVYTPQNALSVPTALSAPDQFYHLNATLHHHKGTAVGQPARPMNHRAVSALRTSYLPTHNTTTGTNPSQLPPRPKPQRYYSQVQRVDMEFTNPLASSSHGPPSDHRRSPPTVAFTDAPRVITNPSRPHRPRRHHSTQTRTRTHPHLPASHHTLSDAQRQRAMSADMTMTANTDKHKHKHKYKLSNRASVPLPFNTRSMPSRESLSMSNSKREAVEMGFEDRQKALIKERVRRANELEDQKEMELSMIIRRGLGDPAGNEARNEVGSEGESEKSKSNNNSSSNSKVMEDEKEVEMEKEKKEEKKEEKEKEKEKQKEEEKEKQKEKEAGCLSGLFRSFRRGTATATATAA